MKLGKYRVISCPKWNISMKFLVAFLGCFHTFQRITNFSYVCQSFSWLTSLLKLGQLRDISCLGWYILLNIFWDIPGMFVLVVPNAPQFLVCLSVLQLAYFLSRISYSLIFILYLSFLWDLLPYLFFYSLIFILYLSLLCFFTNSLKFYSGGAVDLWSCFRINSKSIQIYWKTVQIYSELVR